MLLSNTQRLLVDIFKKEASVGKTNCWEFKDCGRESGGSKVHEMGVCPAATLTDANDYCGGKNGGRACAYITGTFCAGKIQGTHQDKEKNCSACDFYRQVKGEEPAGTVGVLVFSKYINRKKENG